MKTNGLNTTTLSALLASFAALPAAAFASPRDTFNFTNVNSQGLLNEPNNAVRTASAASAYNVSALRISATVSVAAGSASQASIYVQPPNLPGFIVRPFQSQSGSSETVTDLVVQLPNSAAAAADGVWTLRFFEGTVDVPSGPDARWETLSITFDDAPPVTGVVLAEDAFLQFSEVEPNDSKATANRVVDLQIGNVIRGISNPGDGPTALDYFRIKTAASQLALYRHRLVANAPPGLGAPEITLRGNEQVNGSMNWASDIELQRHAIGQTPTSAVSWYGTGRPSEVFVSVKGTQAAATPYDIRYTRESVEAGLVDGLISGPITISSRFGDDIDLVLLDQELRPVPGGVIDEPNTITRTLTAGTYYAAICRGNIAINLPASPDDLARSANLIDFADAIAAQFHQSQTVSLVIADAASQRNVNQTDQGFSNNQGGVGVAFLQLNVLPARPTITGTLSAQPSRYLFPGDTFLVNVALRAASDPESSQLSASLNASSMGLPGAVALRDDGTDGDATPGDLRFSRNIVVPPGLAPGRYTLNVTASDAQGRQAAFSTAIDVGAIIPRAGGVYTEVEPNDTRARANGVLGMRSGDAIVGANPTVADIDIFSVRTAPMAPGIYRHRLTIETDIGGPTGRLLGLFADGLPPVIVDSAIQQTTSFAAPRRTNQWYGFGRGESVVYQINGYPVTQPQYRVGLTSQAVTPIDAGPFRQGSIVISTLNLTTRNTHLVVYDEAFRPVAGANNDDGRFAGFAWFQSRIERSFPEGTYYLAVATAEVANDQLPTAGDSSVSAFMVESPDCVVSTDRTVIASFPFSITDAYGTHTFTASRPETFDIAWFRFQVLPACPLDFDRDGQVATDADMEAFFACLAGSCCASCATADFDADGETGTDADIEAFFRVLGGGAC